MARKYCKCCGLGLVDGEDNSFDICSICGWEDDGVQNDDPDFAGGANALSLNDYRKEFERKREKDPSYEWETSVVELNYGTNKPTEFRRNATDEDISKYHRHNTPKALENL